MLGMLNYFVRRLASGVATFLLAFLVLYSIVVPMAVWERDAIICLDCSLHRANHKELNINSLFKLDKPWPLSYAAWLYDPAGNVPIGQAVEVERTHGGSYSVSIIEVTALGVLLGDFGESAELAQGMSVHEMYGIEFLPLLLACLGVIVAGMIVAVLQRRGRPISLHPIQASALCPSPSLVYFNSGLVPPQCLEKWS